MQCSQMASLGLGLVVLLFAALVASQQAEGTSNGYDEQNTDSPLIHVEQSPGNADDRFPDTYSVWFEHEGRAYYFRLVRDDVVSRALNPSVFRLADFLPDDLMTEDNDQEFAYYHNGEGTGTESRSCFVLHRPSAGQNANLYGKIRDDGDTFLLAHSEGTQHRLRRADSQVHTRKRRNIPTQGVTNIVEIFVWSSPDVFKFHRLRLLVNAKETEEFLRVWEFALIRDVDVIFRTITATPIRAYYLGSGNDRDTSVLWYSDNVRVGRMREEALADVSSYLSNLVQSDVLPFYDHAVVLTRNDVMENFRGRGMDRIGVAVPDSVCGYPPGSSVSIAEVSSPFFEKAIAQSILLAMGVPYDANNNVGTVMDRGVDVTVAISDRAARWLVDPTSQAALADKIDNLIFNCLQVENGAYNPDQFSQENTFGAIYSRVTEQCQIFAGVDSRQCRAVQAADSVCYNGVMCQDINGDCTIDYFTGDRTPCSTGQAASDSCRYGECAFKEISTSTSTSISTSTSTTTAAPTSTTPDSENLASSTTTAPGDCCCERRPLGRVVISMEYVPCN